MYVRRMRDYDLNPMLGKHGIAMARVGDLALAAATHLSVSSENHSNLHVRSNLL